MSSTRNELTQPDEERAAGQTGDGAELIEAQVGGSYQDYETAQPAPTWHQRGDESLAYWQGQAQAYEHKASVYRKALDNLRSNQE
jgi:hypothetical protein